ncbi:MAG: type II toxin-antitoxin system RelB/DinJ family antitoxin [Candidatus Caenarcaniphilales bacterium]|nr:type II toxin-antitoxin system RelB/DinJ family antitoxin [Candidatus Caenarcaniphilales bacterium]
MAKTATTKSATIRARIEPTLKEEVDQILDEIGINWTQVVTMLAKQLRAQRKLPFDVKVPNQKTQEAIDDALRDKNITKFKSKRDLFASWDED